MSPEPGFPPPLSSLLWWGSSWVSHVSELVHLESSTFSFSHTVIAANGQSQECGITEWAALLGLLAIWMPLCKWKHRYLLQEAWTNVSARNSKLREAWTPEERWWQSTTAGKCTSAHLWDNSVMPNCYFKEMLSPWAGCDVQCYENCWAEALNCFSHLLWSRVFYDPSVSDFPLPTLSVDYSMIV